MSITLPCSLHLQDREYQHVDVLNLNVDLSNCDAKELTHLLKTVKDGVRVAAYNAFGKSKGMYVTFLGHNAFFIYYASVQLIYLCRSIFLSFFSSSALLFFIVHSFIHSFIQPLILFTLIDSVSDVRITFSCAR